MQIVNNMPECRENKLAFVSVIVPVYNDEKRIGRCLQALKNQSYPPERYEIIVVDNGSTDRTVEIVQQFQVCLLFEKEIKGSYAARNRGILNAKGRIFGFTDSDCTPVTEWIMQGVQALQENGADLASGNVHFTFSEQKTGAEIYDSLTNMQIERNIADRNVSKTANLFVRAEIFDDIGAFPLVASGGDVLWTGLATTSGYKLVYHHRAEVAHPTRKLSALMRKQYRVGKGQTLIMAASGTSFIRNLWTIVNQLSPMKLISVARWLKTQNSDLTRIQTARVCCAAYLCSIATFWGNMITVQRLWKE